MRPVFLVVFALMFVHISLFGQNINNTIGSSGIFSIKDGSTTFFSLSQSDGRITLPATTAGSTLGVIYKGANWFIHNYRASGTIGNNTFVGVNSGNFTMSGGPAEASYNTAVGSYSLASLTTGYLNSAVGSFALKSNTTGYLNSAFGSYGLNSNTTGHDNSAFGNYALYSNSEGAYNSAFGGHALESNTTGNDNSSFGYFSLTSNSTGIWNSAFGSNSMYSNTTGGGNSAYGFFTLNKNTTGVQNSAFGSSTLRNNTTGSDNSAFGYTALTANTTGSNNSAFGFFAMLANTTGFENTSIGNYSMHANTTGTQNTAVGYNSLQNNIAGWQNTAIGHHSLQNNTGNYNTALGYNAGSTVTTGANLTLIGIDANPSSATANDQITLGNGFVSSLRCNVLTITSLSDARDKKNITELSLGLDFITKLHPRQFNWDRREWYEEGKSDGSKMMQQPTAGFIAQELDTAQTNAGAEWLNLVLKSNPDRLEATPGNLLPIMVKAIQELKSENIELRKELVVILGKLKSVESTARVTMREDN